MTWGLTSQTLPDLQRIEWSLGPVVTRAFRVKNQAADKVIQIAEVEVNRYTPASANDWPEHLTAKDGLKQHILDAADEPAFESLALRGYSMRSARALLGLKDAPDEIGATWDGTLIGATIFPCGRRGPDRTNSAVPTDRSRYSSSATARASDWA